MQDVWHDRRNAILLAVVLMLTAAASVQAAPSPPREARISFQPNTIVEAAFFRIDPARQAEVHERYISKVLPLAEEFGMRSLGIFSVTHVSNGPEDATLWGLFQWPDQASRKRFEADPRYLEVRAVRDELMASFKVVHLKPKRAFTVTFREGHIYEFAGLWMNRTHASHMDDYLAATRPFGQEHGVGLIDAFEVVGTSERYPFQPEKVFIIDWPSEEAKSKWIASEAFQAAGWNRALAIDRLYGVESRFAFPQ